MGVKTRHRKDIDEDEGPTLFDKVNDNGTPMKVRARITPWTRPELEEVIQGLELDQQDPPDLMIPGLLVSAAWYLQREDLPKLCDWLLERLRDLRSKL